MDILFYVFAAALASITIWAPRLTRVRVLALVITTLFIPIIYVEMIEMLSKPMSLEWFERNTDKAVLLGTSLDEGNAIYVWIRLDGSFVPRSYKIPWNLKLAENLEDAVDDVVRDNSTIILKKPFYRKSLDEWGDLNVDIMPPPPCRRKNSSPRPRPASSTRAARVFDARRP